MLTENEFGCFLQKEYIKYIRSLGFSFLVETPERKFGFRRFRPNKEANCYPFETEQSKSYFVLFQTACPKHLRISCDL